MRSALKRVDLPTLGNPTIPILNFISTIVARVREKRLCYNYFMKKETEIWLSIAKEDYKNMKVMRDEKSVRGSVLFAQQCVEKIIKAYICEYRSVNPRKIHFIEKLIEDANLDIAEIGSPDIKVLSSAYGWSRYEDIISSHFKSIQDVIPLLIMAEKIYLWVLSKFKTV